MLITCLLLIPALFVLSPNVPCRPKKNLRQSYHYTLLHTMLFNEVIRLPPTNTLHYNNPRQVILTHLPSLLLYLGAFRCSWSKHAGVTHALGTFPFYFLDIRLSAIITFNCRRHALALGRTVLRTSNHHTLFYKGRQQCSFAFCMPLRLALSPILIFTVVMLHVKPMSCRGFSVSIFFLNSRQHVAVGIHVE